MISASRGRQSLGTPHQDQRNQRHRRGHRRHQQQGGGEPIGEGRIPDLPDAGLQRLVPTMRPTSPDVTRLESSATLSTSRPAATLPATKLREAACANTAPKAATPTNKLTNRVVAMRPPAMAARWAGTSPCMTTFAVSLLSSPAAAP